MIHTQGKTDSLFHGFDFLRRKYGDQAAHFGFGHSLQIIEIDDRFRQYKSDLARESNAKSSLGRLYKRMGRLAEASRFDSPESLRRPLDYFSIRFAASRYCLLVET
jgi:hypothetical protein